MTTFSANKFMICLFVSLGLGVPSLASNVYPVVWQKERGLDPSITLPFSKFYVGDVLVFINPETLPIFQVMTELEYHNCIVDGNTTIRVTKEFIQTFKLTYPGYYYFISDVPDCKSGIRIYLRVDQREAAPIGDVN